MRFPHLILVSREVSEVTRILHSGNRILLDGGLKEQAVLVDKFLRVFAGGAEVDELELWRRRSQPKV